MPNKKNKPLDADITSTNLAELTQALKKARAWKTEMQLLEQERKVKLKGGEAFGPNGEVVTLDKTPEDDKSLKDNKPESS